MEEQGKAVRLPTAPYGDKAPRWTECPRESCKQNRACLDRNNCPTFDKSSFAVSEQVASPATRSAAAIPSNIRRTLEESNLPIEVATAIADRLDAPCEEVEKQVSTLLKLWTDKTTPANKEFVPADYASDLYRKWQEAQEANRELGLWKLRTHDYDAILVEAQNANDRAEAAERDLHHLLAVIHRDGGHYRSTHGTEKAVTDAHTAWAELIGAKEAAEQRAAEAVARERALREWLDNNTTFHNTNDSTVSVLASVSRRIWYHATDDVDKYPFSAVADAAIRARSEGEGT